MAVEGVATTVGHGAVGLFTPFGRINTYITLGVLAFLIVYSCILAVRQDSVLPIVEGVLFKTIGADHSISSALDKLDPILTEDSGSFLSRQWFSYWRAQIVLWTDIIISLWFIYIFIYLIYIIISKVNIEAPAFNVLSAIIIFAVLQLIVGLAMFPMSLAGTTVSGDKLVILSDAFASSYPFEGVVKLVSRIVSGSLFDRIYAFTVSDIGEIVTNVPMGHINVSGV